MARIVVDEISFESLNKDLQEALNILLRHKEEALRYWTKRSCWSCPLEEAYGLSLTFRTWDQFKTGTSGSYTDGPGISPDFGTIQKLTELGWTPKAYDTFMEWFEADDLPEHYMGQTCVLKIAERNNRRNFLKNFLSN